MLFFFPPEDHLIRLPFSTQCDHRPHPLVSAARLTSQSLSHFPSLWSHYRGYLFLSPQTSIIKMRLGYRRLLPISFFLLSSSRKTMVVRVLGHSFNRSINMKLLLNASHCAWCYKHNREEKAMFLAYVALTVLNNVLI